MKHRSGAWQVFHGESTSGQFTMGFGSILYGTWNKGMALWSSFQPWSSAAVFVFKCSKSSRIEFVYMFLLQLYVLFAWESPCQPRSSRNAQWRNTLILPVFINQIDYWLSTTACWSPNHGIHPWAITAHPKSCFGFTHKTIKNEGLASDSTVACKQTHSAFGIFHLSVVAFSYFLSTIVQPIIFPC